MLVARGKATKERHPGLGNVDSTASAHEYLQERLVGIGRKERMKKEGEDGLGDWGSGTPETEELKRGS